MDSGLARVTISAPRRRLDVALPEHLPLADLLPDVLRQAGVGLADLGERHGGWVLRRTDGVALDGARPLRTQGVPDGAVLHLVPARAHWPAPEYDDVVEVIADGARTRGGTWTSGATRRMTLVAASVPAAVGLVAVLRAGPAWSASAPIALGVAVVLLLAGVLASRAFGEGTAGAVLATGALPFAGAGAALLVSSGDPVGPVAGLRWLGAPELLSGSTVALLTAVVGAVGVAAGLRMFATAATVAGLAVPAALAGYLLTGPRVAAALLTVLVLAVGLAPLVAIRLGRMPIPPVTLPPGDEPPRSDGSAGSATHPVDITGTSGAPPLPAGGLPQRGEVLAAVARTDDLLVGLLAGHAILVTAAMSVLVTAGGSDGRVLAAVGSAVLLLRARLFVAPRQRVSQLAAGLAGAAVLGGGLVGTAGPTGRLLLAGGGSIAALLIVAFGVGYARRPPSPYLARIGDLLETGLVISVVPVACAVFDLYGRARGLLG
ncbi:type VII secretion integral membrane protein EccD [Plantactinospora sp. GCM10030261]|uniref:type VII secretion integral membrane protein EccD n=1 Tax=Plantactinospora sp. GCM10030261 TaxID=3273420 RepID=UPI003613603F